MSSDEKETGVTAGLTITHPQAARADLKRTEVLPTIEDVDSVHSMTPTLTPTATRGEDRESSPFSPFYSHPTTRNSHDAKNSESKTHIHTYDSDVEACLTDSGTNVMPSSLSKRAAGTCSVWPGQQALLEQKRQEKLQRKGRFNPMRNLSKRGKLYAKIAIGALVVGLAVGVGIGVSKAVGGGVFKTNNTSAPVA